MHKKLLCALLTVVSACSEPAQASSVEDVPSCLEVRRKYALLTAMHRRLAARGYLVSTRERFVERAQLSEKYHECFFETDLGELR